ncbi:MAG: CinA family protein [Ruminococcus sp.]|nr:CinA family protein [Ruminococcus sp.]
MITLTEIDIIQLLRKNNLNADTLQENVVETLIKHNLKVATAESCTGGLVSERITRVSGSSEVFDCGICSYSNRIKHKILGVSESTLSVLGAVSAETAIQMAEGVKKLSDADIGLSTTGIAGPTGSTPEKPVGLVYMGVCTKNKSYALKLDFSSASNRKDARNYIRKLTSDAVLFTILNIIYGEL